MPKVRTPRPSQQPLSPVLRKLLTDIASEFAREKNIFYDAATRSDPTAVRRANLYDRIQRQLRKG